MKILVHSRTVVARWKGGKDGICDVPEHVAKAYLASGMASKVKGTRKRRTKAEMETAALETEVETR